MDVTQAVINNTLISKIKAQFLLNWQGNHGIKHWARVYDIGMRLSEIYGANQGVIQLFALFHDACRENEKNDQDHGKRAADLALKLKGQYFDLPDDDFQLLHIACRNHTHVETHDDITVQICFDSDRLDLGRVEIVPDPEYLCTEAAKSSDMIDWAHKNSVEGKVPTNILGLYPL